MNTNSDEIKDNSFRWEIDGHEYIGKQLTIRAAALPAQHIEQTSEGAEGVIVKWAPSLDPKDSAFFKLYFEGADPLGNLGGGDGCGIDLEEYEVRALMAMPRRSARAHGSHTVG